MYAGYLHIVEQDERRIAAFDGANLSAYLDKWVRTHLASGYADVHARHNALQSAPDVGNGSARKVFVNVYAGNRPRKVGFLLCAISHNHHFVKCLAVFFQHDVHVGCSPERLGQETHIRHDDLGVGRGQVQFELAVDVGYIGVVCAFFGNAYADKRFAVAVCHHALGHLALLLQGYRVRQKAAGGQAVGKCRRRNGPKRERKGQHERSPHGCGTKRKSFSLESFVKVVRLGRFLVHLIYIY